MEIRGAAEGLLDEPLALRARGAGPDAAIAWRGRFRDDEGVVWRASAPGAAGLALSWRADRGSGAIAALGSLRPVRIDVRAEARDGPAADRALVRRLAADGVRRRRWREGLAATLHLPPTAAPCATVVLDATAGPEAAAAGALAASLLASRGVLALTLGPSRAADPLGAAIERLRLVPGAREAIEVVAAPIPPGVGVRADRPGGPEARAAAWDDLLARLGAEPRATDHA